MGDPFLVLNMITNWLKPGGQLLFSVPNANGLSFKVFKGYCHTTHAPYHLHHFTDHFIYEILRDDYNVKNCYYKAERDILDSMTYLSDDKKSIVFCLTLPKYHVFFLK